MSRIKNFIRPVVALLAASLLFSCMKEEPMDFRLPDNDIDMGADREIRFGVKGGTATKAAAPAGRVALDCDRSKGIQRIVVEYEDMPVEVGPDTKMAQRLDVWDAYVTATTGTAGSESNVWNSVAFERSSDTFTGGKVWPTSDPGYHFYAATLPITFNATGCTITTTNAEDTNPACAYLENPAYATKNTLNFLNIYGRIGSVMIAADTGCTISGVTVNVTPKIGGTYNIRTGAWSSVINGSVTNIARSIPGSQSNDIFVVPGTYTAYASWSSTKGGNTRTYTNVPFDFTVAASGKTNISLTLGGEVNFQEEYLTFDILTGGTVTWGTDNTGGTAPSRTISYRKNAGSWTSISQPSNISVNAGDKLEFKGTNTRYGTGSSSGAYCGGCFKVSGGATFNVSGNIMSLIGGDSFSSLTSLTGSGTFTCLFANNTGLKSAQNLCLPATSLISYCYQAMFKGCTALTTPPQVLPATSLSAGTDQYSHMFDNCNAMTSAPVLSATTLSIRCYDSMFADCWALAAPPTLPAMTLANSCYRYMFMSCVAMSSAPALPALHMEVNCYDGMFCGCRFTTAPALPSTDLAEDCYQYMFIHCSNLTSIELPATTLATLCYNHMLENCTSLTYVKALFTTTPGSGYTEDWLNNVAASGTFVKSSAASWNVTGSSGVPSGWTVSYE